jgi:hypothetical protein
MIKLLVNNKAFGPAEVQALLDRMAGMRMQAQSYGIIEAMELLDDATPLIEAMAQQLWHGFDDLAGVSLRSTERDPA